MGINLPYLDGLSGSIMIVAKCAVSVGVAIVGLVLGSVGTILTVGGIVYCIGTMLRVSLSMLRSRKVSSSKGKK